MQGDLSEIPLPELLGVLSGKSGILHLDGVPLIGRMDIHVSRGNISACIVAEQFIRKDGGIIEKLIAVTIMAEGRFEFEVIPPERLHHRCKIPAQGIALEVASRADEIVAQLSRAPDSAQIFRWTGNPTMATYPDPLLNWFIEEAAELLRSGSNAEKLAEYLQISVAQARHHLGTLLESGSVTALHRDAIWSRLDRALDAKSATPLKVLKPDGSIGIVKPLPALVPGKSDSQLIGSAGQKIVPKLMRQPVNKPFPESKPPGGS